MLLSPLTLIAQLLCQPRMFITIVPEMHKYSLKSIWIAETSHSIFKLDCRNGKGTT